MSDMLEKREFFIFGNNIAHSLSPTIHNTSFAEYALPYHYSIYQTPSIDEDVRAMIRSPTFGGASVTFPHKLAIAPLLDDHSEAAKLIGATNTIVRDEGILKGENTDWIGILRVLTSHGFTTSESSIVIGAGGAARAAVFALQHLGVKNVTIVNRTESTAWKIAAAFPAMNITFRLRLEDAPASNIIIGCIPADDIAVADVPQEIFGAVGIVVEMSYRPPISALMKVAWEKKWKVANGVDVLKEQAYAQFEMWTGKTAPVAAIEKALGTK